MIEVSIPQKDVTIVNIYAPKAKMNGAKWRNKQKYSDSGRLQYPSQQTDDLKKDSVRKHLRTLYRSNKPNRHVKIIPFINNRKHSSQVQITSYFPGCILY